MYLQKITQSLSVQFDEFFTKQTPKWRPRILIKFQESPFDTSQSLGTTPYPKQTLLWFLPSWIVLSFLINKLYLSEIIQNIYFLVWLFWLRNLFLRFFYVFVGSNISFVLIVTWYIFCCMHIWQFFFFSFFCQWYLAYFHFETIKSCYIHYCSLNIHVHIPIGPNETAGSRCRHMFSF